MIGARVIVEDSLGVGGGGGSEVQFSRSKRKWPTYHWVLHHHLNTPHDQ